MERIKITCSIKADKQSNGKYLICKENKYSNLNRNTPICVYNSELSEFTPIANIANFTLTDEHKQKFLSKLNKGLTK